jgi:hypothetical protein
LYLRWFLQFLVLVQNVKSHRKLLEDSWEDSWRIPGRQESSHESSQEYSRSPLRSLPRSPPRIHQESSQDSYRSPPRSPPRSHPGVLPGVLPGVIQESSMSPPGVHPESTRSLHRSPPGVLTGVRPDAASNLKNEIACFCAAAATGSGKQKIANSQSRFDDVIPRAEDGGIGASGGTEVPPLLVQGEEWDKWSLCHEKCAIAWSQII